jgi:hypothetical protein
VGPYPVKIAESARRDKRHAPVTNEGAGSPAARRQPAVDRELQPIYQFTPL